ncbi:hypothetical protein SDC9_160412 [bioreactor metagenome]|uniref:Uncharacterized protein n=1 Tax=bioreactor metagenome TaxID=1076179 RepID=A0A645FHU2_9ZZZZ
MNLFQRQEGLRPGELPRGARHFAVGAVTPVGRVKDGILAAIAQGHEFVRHRPPHHA